MNVLGIQCLTVRTVNRLVNEWNAAVLSFSKAVGLLRESNANGTDFAKQYYGTEEARLCAENARLCWNYTVPSMVVERTFPLQPWCYTQGTRFLESPDETSGPLFYPSERRPEMREHYRVKNPTLAILDHDGQDPDNDPKGRRN
jgi:hypothetical protein